MNSTLGMRHYQQQAVRTSSPELIVLKLYDIGIAASHRGDHTKLRAVLVELISSLNFEAGGEIATRLAALYEYCLTQCTGNDAAVVGELLTELRDAWKTAVVGRQAA